MEKASCQTIYLYAYNPIEKFNFKLKKFSSSKLTYEILFDSPFKTNIKNNDLIYFNFYPSLNITELKPLVILLHGFGSKPNKLNNYFDFIEFLRSNNFSSIFMHLPYHLSRTPENESSGERLIYFDDKQTLEFFHQAVVDIRKVIHFSKSVLKFNDIILIGFSLGSMISAIVSAFEKNISKTVLILGGGNWHEVHWCSLLSHVLKGNCLKQENDKIDKNKCKKIYQNFYDFKEEFKKIDLNQTPIDFTLLNNPELKSKTTKLCFLCDPLAFTNLINKDKILMINSRFDHYFNKKSTIELWKNIGKPKIYWFNKFHTSSILKNSKVQKIILDFIN